MIGPLLALAFGAGMLAPVNPCGFAVLPAYLAYAVDTTADRSNGHRGTLSRLAGGVRAGSALTAGFAGTLTIIGVLLALGLRSLIVSSRGWPPVLVPPWPSLAWSCSPAGMCPCGCPPAAPSSRGTGRWAC